MQNPLTVPNNNWLKSEVLQNIPFASDIIDDNYLSLSKYVNSIPERLFCRETYSIYFSWFQDNDQTRPEELKQILHDSLFEIDNALRHMSEVCSQNWHDSPFSEKGDDHKQLVFIDEKLHPAYLRLLEGVLKPLLKPIAHFSRVDRGKGTADLNDIFCVVAEVEQTGATILARVYHNTMRNGIAHGGVRYLDRKIRYDDKKGKSITFSILEIIDIFDDLVDTCNALILAYSVFVKTKKRSDFVVPGNLLIEDLKAETNAPYWSVTGCLVSENSKGKQLNIYAKGDSRDGRKVQFSTVQTGILAEKFSPGFDRYFVKIQTSLSLLGFAAFDGRKIKEHRLNNKQIDEYTDIVEDGLVAYQPNWSLPKFLVWFHSIYVSYQANWNSIVYEFKEKMAWNDLLIRDVQGHRNSWGLVVKGRIVLNSSNSDKEFTKDEIRKVKKRIIRLAVKKARKELPRLSFLRLLPVGYADVSVYRRDFRKRKFVNYGLGGDLICTIRLQHITRIQAPDIFGSTIEQVGSYRIAWNQSWLNTETHT